MNVGILLDKNTLKNWGPYKHYKYPKWRPEIQHGGQKFKITATKGVIN